MNILKANRKGGNKKSRARKVLKFRLIIPMFASFVNEFRGRFKWCCRKFFAQISRPAENGDEHGGVRVSDKRLINHTKPTRKIGQNDINSINDH